MSRQLLKKTWYLLFNDHPYTYPGRICIKFLPASYLSHFYDEFYSGKGPSGLFANMVRAELNRQYYSKAEEEIRRLNRDKFWGAKAGLRCNKVKKELFSNEDKFRTEYLKLKEPLIFQISELLSTGNRYHTICEIGTGHGMFLAHLSKRFTGIRKFIGIDLNKEQILENEQTYKDTSLEFIQAEISDWIRAHCEKGSIFIASGTFQYFTQKELCELFRLVRERGNPAAIAITEAINLDLNNELMSKPRGNTAFSHNYPYLFEQCNYHIFRQQVDRIDPAIAFYDQINMIATTSHKNSIL